MTEITLSKFTQIEITTEIIFTKKLPSIKIINFKI